MLNSHYSGMILDLLGRVHAEGQTIVMVIYDLRSALRGSRILYLHDGKIRGELDLGERRGPDGSDGADGDRIERPDIFHTFNYYRFLIVFYYYASPVIGAYFYSRVTAGGTY